MVQVKLEPDGAHLRDGRANVLQGQNKYMFVNKSTRAELMHARIFPYLMSSFQINMDRERMCVCVEAEAAIRDVSSQQRKVFTEFHFAESQQCENKQQREWHNKSLTSSLCVSELS